MRAARAVAREEERRAEDRMLGFMVIFVLFLVLREQFDCWKVFLGGRVWFLATAFRIVVEQPKTHGVFPIPRTNQGLMRNCDFFRITRMSAISPTDAGAKA